MGWTSTHLPYGRKLTDYLTENFTWESEEASNKVIASSLVRFRTWYAAIERTYKKTGEREVFAAVVLIQMCPSSDYNLSYKDMTEHSGPCQADCPERILDLLTDTDSDYAKDWRQKCRDRLGNKRPALKTGHWILFEKPVEFRDNTKHRLMKIENARRGRYRSPDGSYYRIGRTHLRWYKYRVLNFDAIPFDELPLMIGDDPDLNREIGRRLAKGK